MFAHPSQVVCALCTLHMDVHINSFLPQCEKCVLRRHREMYDLVLHQSERHKLCFCASISYYVQQTCYAFRVFDFHTHAVFLYKAS